MKVALCCIGRLENRYAIEFVEYYKKLDVDNIIIYDNNYDGEEHFEDVLQSYIDDNFVIIKDVRNWHNCQACAYVDCYNNYHLQYDYIIYVDFDEYIYLVKDKTIKKYLSRNINNYNVIQLNWKIYTDNDLIYYEDKPILERFTKPMSKYKHVSYDSPENAHIKCIIKCVFDSIDFENSHTLYFNYLKDKNNYKICNNAFKDKQLQVSYFEQNKNGKIDYSLAYVKHFFTKTIDEYINNKRKRGTIEGGTEDMKERYKGKFFKINKRTKEKDQYCIEHNIDPYTL